MKLASYKATRPGLQGVANRLIRWRLRGPYSHNELVFEPGDGVAALMPDGTCAADARGALWCASSVAAEQDHMIFGKRQNSPFDLPGFARYAHTMTLESW